MSDPMEMLVLAGIIAGAFGAGWIGGAWFGVRVAVEAMRR